MNSTVIYGNLYQNGNIHNSHIQFYYRRKGRVLDLRCYLPFRRECYNQK